VSHWWFHESHLAKIYPLYQRGRLYVGDLKQGNAHRQNASAAETGKPGFTWKMAARTVCVAAVMLMELVLDLLL